VTSGKLSLRFPNHEAPQRVFFAPVLALMTGFFVGAMAVKLGASVLSFALCLTLGLAVFGIAFHLTRQYAR
jgi:hypothetical protein